MKRQVEFRFFYILYSLLTTVIFIIILPAFWLYTYITGHYSRHFSERLGFIPLHKFKDSSRAPRIWIHAVSLGEVKVASSIVSALQEILPDSFIIISTITEHGRDMAKEIFKDQDLPVIYAPFDFCVSVYQSLSIVRPDVMVFLETEIWPAWILEARRLGIKIAILNGRISQHSFKNYIKLRYFFREVLCNINYLSMITEEDASRIKAIGAKQNKIEVNGNAKFDLLISSTDFRIKAEVRQILKLNKSQPVFVAGSTREGEEVLILKTYKYILKKFPDTILIIAPRHIDRATEIGTEVTRSGFRYQLRTEIGQDTRRHRTAQVLIINTFGELFRIYSIGTIIFCGGSLVPLGGQNPLEPAAWEKFVFFGPHMDNFLDEKTLLEENGGGIEVLRPELMAKKAVWFLDHPDQLKLAGKRARQVVLLHEKAAKKHAQVIQSLLSS